MEKEAIVAWAKARMLSTDEVPLEIGYRYYHGLRVAALALELVNAESLVVNQELLFIGALLHDVGKAGDKGKGHGPRGAELIQKQIPHLFGQDELERVTQIVAYHYMRPKSKYMLGKPDPGWPQEVLLVQDADTLDHFGANGIWIAHHFATVEKRNQQSSIDRHIMEDEAWKQESQQAMNYPAALRELEHRISCMDNFVWQWAREEQGQLTFRRLEEQL